MGLETIFHRGSGHGAARDLSDFSKRSSKSVVPSTSVMNFTRSLDGIIPSSNLSETTGIKTTPKNDRMALTGGLLQVGVRGAGRVTGGKLNQELNYSIVSPQKMRRHSAWTDKPSIRDP